MSEIPTNMPHNESIRDRNQLFSLESKWIAHQVADAINDGSLDVNDLKVDLALRNASVLADRVDCGGIDLEGQLTTLEFSRLDTLQQKSAAIITLADADPREYKNYLMGVQYLVATNKMPLELSPFVANTIREGNALVGHLTDRGVVAPRLVEYFSGNIIAAQIKETE